MRYYLRLLPTTIRFILLFFIGISLFTVGIIPRNFYPYYLWTITLLSTFALFFAIPIPVFFNLLQLWVIGTFTYSLVALPWAYSNLGVTPYFEVVGIYNRLIYLSYRPVMILGVFSSGLLFVYSTNPSDFLVNKTYRNSSSSFSQYIYTLSISTLLLFRFIDLVMDDFMKVRQSFIIDDKWPDRQSNYFSQIYTILYNSFDLFTCVVRNTLTRIHAIWLSFEQTKRSFE